MKGIRDFRRGDWAFISVIAILYYFLIRQYVQIVEDTYYSLVHPGYDRRVLTLGDAMYSQIYDYLNINGRYLVHTFTQYMCGSDYGDEIYYIGSTICFTLLIAGIILIIRKDYNSSPTDKYLILAFLFFSIPVIGRVFLGHISHVVNYLWSSTLFVYFFICYKYLREQSTRSIPWYKFLYLLIFGLIFGSWQESFSIPVGLYFFLYYLYNYKDIIHLNKGLLALLSGFLLGACVGVLAPSNFSRFIYFESNLSGIEKYATVIKILSTCYYIWIFFILILFLFIVKRKIIFAFLKENFFFICVILCNLFFSVFVAFSGVHQLVVTYLCISILYIKLIFHFSILNKHLWLKNTLPTIVSIIMLLLYIPIYYYRNEIKEGWEMYKKDALTCTNKIITANKLFLLQRTLNSNNFFQDYTNIVFMNVHLSNDKDYLRDFSLMLTDGKKKDLVELVLPEKKDTIVEQGKHITGKYGLYSLPCSKFYVLKINKNMPWENTVFNVRYKPSYLGKIKKEVLKSLTNGRYSDVINMRIPKLPFTFIEGNYRYVMINLSPDWYSSFEINKIE